MSKDLSYKIETISLLNQLASSISNSIIIKKNEEENGLIINRTNPSETVSFFFNVPSTDFDFDGNEISFYNFPEFFQLLSVFKDPKITQDNNKLVISKNSSKIKYVLSDSEIISEGPKGFKIDIEPNTIFELTDAELKDFGKMIGLVGAERANLKVDDNKLTVTLGNETHENTFEKVFSVINSDGESVGFNIPAEIFTIVPNGNYKISIWKDGIVIFELKHPNVSLKIMTAELESE
jgi:hypothetical protein